MRSFLLRGHKAILYAFSRGDANLLRGTSNKPAQFFVRAIVLGIVTMQQLNDGLEP